MDYKELLKIVDALESKPSLEELTRQVASYLFAVGLSEDVEPNEAFMDVSSILIDRMCYHDLMEEPELQAVQATIVALNNLGYIALEEEF